MRGKEKLGKTNCGKIVEVRVNLGETGMGRVLSLRIAVLFNLRCTRKKKIYIYVVRYSCLAYKAFAFMSKLSTLLG